MVLPSSKMLMEITWKSMVWINLFKHFFYSHLRQLLWLLTHKDFSSRQELCNRIGQFTLLQEKINWKQQMGQVTLSSIEIQFICRHQFFKSLQRWWLIKKLLLVQIVPSTFSSTQYKPRSFTCSLFYQESWQTTSPTLVLLISLSLRFQLLILPTITRMK
jgi:hypothetical protein